MILKFTFAAANTNFHKKYTTLRPERNVLHFEADVLECIIFNETNKSFIHI